MFQKLALLPSPGVRMKGSYTAGPLKSAYALHTSVFTSTLTKMLKQITTCGNNFLTEFFTVTEAAVYA
jgi:hypothetical protein